MGDTKFYIAGAEATQRIEELTGERAAALKAARALSREIGAKEYATGNDFGHTQIHGFKFDDESKVDPKVLRKDKHGWWVPRRVKAARELEQKMWAIRIPGGMSVAKAIGVEWFFGGRWSTPGVQKLNDGRYLITVDSEAGAPAGCERISDIEAEALLAEAAGRAE